MIGLLDYYAHVPQSERPRTIRFLGSVGHHSGPGTSWLAENAWQWGFILRYPNGYTDITGYEFEPWHYRYVGVELATEMRETGVATLEEFFGLPAAPTY